MLQKAIGLILVLGIASVLPFAVGLYNTEILILLLINLIMAQSYRLVTTAGDWSSSQVVMMGVGAYTAALLAKFLGWPFLITVLLGGVAASLGSLLIILPLLRTRGFGFFIATFALAEAIRLVWVKFQYPFGGARGMIGIPGAEIGPWDLSEMIPSYFLILVIAVLLLWIMYRIERSRMGNLLKAIRIDAELTASIGVSVRYYRALTFATANFFAGIAGALLAYHQGAIDPKSFAAVPMLYLIIYVVVGGVRSYWGAIIGVIVMTGVLEMTRQVGPWRPFIAGAIVIFVLVAMPGGLEILVAPIARGLRKVPGLSWFIADPQHQAGARSGQ